MSSVGAPGTSGPTPHTTGCVPLARNWTSRQPSRRSSPATHSAAARQSALWEASVDTDGIRKKLASSRNRRSVSMAGTNSSARRLESQEVSDLPLATRRGEGGRGRGRGRGEILAGGLRLKKKQQ